MSSDDGVSPPLADGSAPTTYTVAKKFYQSLSHSYKLALVYELVIAAIGILLIAAGLSLRGEQSWLGTTANFASMIGFAIVFITLVFVIRDAQLVSLARIPYQIKVEKQGISLFALAGGTANDPSSYIPFAAVTEAKITRVTPFVRKGTVPSIVKVQFLRAAKEHDLSGVLLTFRIDPHLNTKPNRQLFFQLPPGTNLYITEEPNVFLKDIERRRRVPKSK